MSYVEGLQNVEDMFYKLVREAERLTKAENSENRIDSLFNFCVTSISLRDWVMRYLELPDNNRDPECVAFCTEHNKYNSLKYCASIANTVKHFKITKGKSTVDGIKRTRREYCSMFLDGKILSTEEQDEYEITIDNGEVWGVFELVFHTVEDWISFLKSKDVLDLDFYSADIGGRVFFSTPVTEKVRS